MPGLFGIVPLPMKGRAGEGPAGPAADLGADLDRMAAALRFRDGDVAQTHVDPGGAYGVGRIGPPGGNPSPWPLEASGGSRGADTPKRVFAVGDPRLGGPDHGLSGPYAALIEDARGRIAVQADRRGYHRTYYEIRDDRLIFAPELKGILALRDAPPPINLGSVATFIVMGYVYRTNTFLQGVRRLADGTRIEITKNGIVSENEYFRYLPGSRAAAKPDRNALKDDLIDLIVESARHDYAEDPRTVIYLSGGMDSRAILAAAVRAGARGVPTVTWADKEAGPMGDPAIAAQVAAHLGADHRELRRTWDDGPAEFQRVNTLVESRCEMGLQHAPELRVLEQLADSGFTRALRGDHPLGIAKTAYSLEYAARRLGMRHISHLEKARQLLVGAIRQTAIDASEANFDDMQDRYGALPPDQAKDSFWFEMRLPGYLQAANHWRQTVFDERNTLMSDEILDFMARVPDELRGDKVLLRHAMAEMTRDWPEIPYATEDALFHFQHPDAAGADFEAYADAALADTGSGIWSIIDRDRVMALSRGGAYRVGEPDAKRRLLRSAQSGLRSVAPKLAERIALRMKQGDIPDAALFWRVIILKDWYDRFVDARR